MKKTAVLSFLATSIMLISCQKEYTCVCTNRATGEKTLGDKVKTTKLGKKGFEESCKANNDAVVPDLTDCHVE